MRLYGGRGRGQQNSQETKAEGTGTSNSPVETSLESEVKAKAGEAASLQQLSEPHSRPLACNSGRAFLGSGGGEDVTEGRGMGDFLF